jgi:hypothetical protein
MAGIAAQARNLETTQGGGRESLLKVGRAELG